MLSFSFQKHQSVFSRVGNLNKTEYQLDHLAFQPDLNKQSKWFKERNNKELSCQWVGREGPATLQQGKCSDIARHTSPLPKGKLRIFANPLILVAITEKLALTRFKANSATAAAATKVRPNLASNNKVNTEVGVQSSRTSRILLKCTGARPSIASD